MSRQQQRRVEIIARTGCNGLSKVQAAELLGISRRHVDNVVHRYRVCGMTSVVHGNTGRTPPNKTSQEVGEAIAALAGEGGKYHDLSVCHMQELLAQREGIAIGRSTLDRLLKVQGVRPPRRRRRAIHRRRRNRASAEGMLLQIDACEHDWLEGRGPRLALMGAIDDATSKVTYLRFGPAEDQAAYLLMLRTMAQTDGLPQALYHDRHTILRSPKEPSVEDELAGKTPQSQVQAVIAALGIESIAAYSPQAKGRIERLWGILQDRLVKEMRLAGISSIEEANAFLPGFIQRFNARFAVQPADPEPAWVPIQPDMDLDYYFSTRHTRVVRADYTIAWNGQVLQILRHPHDPVLVRQTITVHVTPSGELCLYHGKTRLRHCLAPARAPQPAPRKPVQAPPKPKTPPDPKAAARRRAWLFAGVPQPTAHDPVALQHQELGNSP